MAPCYRAVVGAPGADSCWDVDVLSTVGGKCRDRLNEHVKLGSGRIRNAQPTRNPLQFVQTLVQRPARELVK